MINGIQDRIFTLKERSDFEESALEIFNYQFENNPVYNEFVTGLRKDPRSINKVYQIPFLPVEFFRNREIITGDHPVEMIFESSGTAGMVPGKHFVTDLKLYERSFTRTFRLFYGDPQDYLITALLPSYTEREGSSLVYMAEKLIKASRHSESGFYRDNIPELIETIKSAKKEDIKILLLGVSFALLDLAEQYSPDLSGVFIMETGGMKGRRKELTRQELHEILKENLNVPAIHSEYGMTELLSQAYSKGEGLFLSPPWMKVLIRDPQDPLTIYKEHGKTGGINIIDLANINSCSFIATGDLGKIHEYGGFEVLGRFDNSDVRGCNLLAE